MQKQGCVTKLDDLDLAPQTLEALKEANVSFEEVIRVSGAYTYLPGRVLDMLVQYTNIGKARAEEIVRAVDEAGFILHESDRSRQMRVFLSALGSSAPLELYEELEEMEPTALQAADDLIREALPARERRVVELCFGLNEGAQLCSLEECARELGYTKERVRELRTRALSRLRRPDDLYHLEVVICYSRGYLTRRMVDLGTQIDRLRLELEALQEASPYPELKGIDVAKMVSSGQPLEFEDLSVRVQNSLKRIGVKTDGEIFELYLEDPQFGMVPRLGHQGAEELVEFLRQKGVIA